MVLLISAVSMVGQVWAEEEPLIDKEYTNPEISDYEMFIDSQELEESGGSEIDNEEATQEESETPSALERVTKAMNRIQKKPRHSLSNYESLKNSEVYDERLEAVQSFLVGDPEDPFIPRVKRVQNQDPDSLEMKLWFSKIFYVGQRKD